MPDLRPLRLEEKEPKEIREQPRQIPEVEAPPELEKVMEAPPEEAREEEKPEVQVPPQPPPSPPPAGRVEKTKLRQDIEHILEENLEDVYIQLPKDIQKTFLEKGEETASTIERLLQRARVHARKVLQLIQAWLSVIPGANRFFVRQEAKIKTDKILLLKKKD